MEDFIFHEGDVPESYTFAFELSLFNQKEFLSLQSQGGWKSFYILHKKNHQVVAAFYIHCENDKALSPLRSPYGSVEMTDHVPPKVLFHFLEFVELKLKNNGIKQIIIKTSPSSYQSQQAVLWQTSLFNQGYSVCAAEVGAVIEVTEHNFLTLLHNTMKRKLRKVSENDFTFRILTSESLSVVYNFILACRQERGYELSMSYSEVEKVVKQFKDRYILFAVMQGERIAAASIAILVRSNILYNFYPAHAREYNAISPSILLTEGIYKFCQQNKIELLDLGTSALNGKPNFGLLEFKLQLGATLTNKLTFEKTLS